MHQMWRLSEAVPQNLELAGTDDGLLLGRTSLIERRDGRFVVRSAAENNDPMRRSGASPDAVDNWSINRIDELGDFLEWLANAKPEDEQIIRAEINRDWGSVGDFHAVGTLNYMLSQVFKPGTTPEQRQQILELIDNYSR